MSRRNKRKNVAGGRTNQVQSFIQNMDQFANQLQQAAQQIRTEAKRLRSVTSGKQHSSVVQSSSLPQTGQQRLSRRQRRAQRQQGSHAQQSWSQGGQPSIQNLTQVGQVIGQAIAKALAPQNGQGQRSTPFFNFGGNTKSKNSTVATYRS